MILRGEMDETSREEFEREKLGKLLKGRMLWFKGRDKEKVKTPHLFLTMICCPSATPKEVGYEP